MRGRPHCCPGAPVCRWSRETAHLDATPRSCGRCFQSRLQPLEGPGLEGMGADPRRVTCGEGGARLGWPSLVCPWSAFKPVPLVACTFSVDLVAFPGSSVLFLRVPSLPAVGGYPARCKCIFRTSLLSPRDQVGSGDAGREQSTLPPAVCPEVGAGMGCWPRARPSCWVWGFSLHNRVLCGL